MQVRHPKPFALLNSLLKNHTPALGPMLRLRHTAIGLDGLDMIQAQFTRHAHHIVHAATNQRHGQAQLRQGLHSRFKRLCTIAGQLQLITGDEQRGPEMSPAIHHIHLATKLQTQHFAQVAHFLVIQMKAAMLPRRGKPAGIDEQASSFCHGRGQPMPGKTLSGCSSTGQSSFAPPINSSSS